MALAPVDPARRRGGPRRRRHRLHGHRRPEQLRPVPALPAEGGDRAGTARPAAACGRSTPSAASTSPARSTTTCSSSSAVPFLVVGYALWLGRSLGWRLPSVDAARAASSRRSWCWRWPSPWCATCPSPATGSSTATSADRHAIARSTLRGRRRQARPEVRHVRFRELVLSDASGGDTLRLAFHPRLTVVAGLPGDGPPGAGRDPDHGGGRRSGRPGAHDRRGLGGLVARLDRAGPARRGAGRGAGPARRSAGRPRRARRAGRLPPRGGPPGGGDRRARHGRRSSKPTRDEDGALLDAAERIDELQERVAKTADRAERCRRVAAWAEGRLQGITRPGTRRPPKRPPRSSTSSTGGTAPTRPSSASSASSRRTGPTSWIPTLDRRVALLAPLDQDRLWEAHRRGRRRRDPFRRRARPPIGPRGGPARGARDRDRLRPHRAGAGRGGGGGALATRHPRLERACRDRSRARAGRGLDRRPPRRARRSASPPGSSSARGSRCAGHPPPSVASSPGPVPTATSACTCAG